MNKISEIKAIVYEYILENVDLENKKEVSKFDELLQQLSLRYVKKKGDKYYDRNSDLYRKSRKFFRDNYCS